MHILDRPFSLEAIEAREAVLVATISLLVQNNTEETHGYSIVNARKRCSGSTTEFFNLDNFKDGESKHIIEFIFRLHRRRPTFISLYLVHLQEGRNRAHVG